MKRVYTVIVLLGALALSAGCTRHITPEHVSKWNQTCKTNDGIKYWKFYLVMDDPLGGVKCNNGAYFTEPVDTDSDS